MNQKFQLKRALNVTQMDEATRARYTNHIATLPDGDYEIIIRKAVKWDTARMRKYFHGVVLDFIKEQFKIIGRPYSKPQIKEFLKSEFGRQEPLFLGPTESKVREVPASTSEYTFEDYKIFLNDINAWCLDCFQYELPPSDEVE